ncbi:MAG: BrnT family toxin [Chloroflexi bacterium]|nr:BrnT family toxin [Chloroflexota bacterium]
MLFIRRLVWDPFNVAHIARHAVVSEEVEAVCQGDPVVETGKQGRLLVFGPTRAGRILTVVLDATETAGVYYVVTARPASRRERRIYARTRGGGEEQ